MNELPSKFIQTRTHTHIGLLTLVSIAPRFNLEEITLALAMINHKQPQHTENTPTASVVRVGSWQPQDRTRCYVARYGRGRQDAWAKSNNMWICYLFWELWKSQQVPALCILFLIRVQRQVVRTHSTHKCGKSQVGGAGGRRSANCQLLSRSFLHSSGLRG